MFVLYQNSNDFSFKQCMQRR